MMDQPLKVTSTHLGEEHNTWSECGALQLLLPDVRAQSTLSRFFKKISCNDVFHPSTLGHY